MRIKTDTAEDIYFYSNCSNKLDLVRVVYKRAFNENIILGFHILGGANFII